MKVTKYFALLYLSTNKNVFKREKPVKQRKQGQNCDIPLLPFFSTQNLPSMKMDFLILEKNFRNNVAPPLSSRSVPNKP